MTIEDRPVGLDAVDGEEPSLVVVCGLPGTGKTTVAAAVAERLDAERLRTDVVRKELFPEPEYTDAEAEAVYEELLARAGEHLAADRTVVLDGTFHERAYRDAAAAVADERAVPLTVVRVTCDRDVVRERIRARTDDESDADFGVHELFREQFEPPEREHVVVDNSGDLAATHDRVRELF